MTARRASWAMVLAAGPLALWGLWGCGQRLGADRALPRPGLLDVLVCLGGAWVIRAYYRNRMRVP
jgi:hypothetical protein